jgi:hypothetical protein
MLTFPFSLNNLLGCMVYCSKRASAKSVLKIVINLLFNKDLSAKDAGLSCTAMAQNTKPRATQRCASAPNASASHRHGAPTRMYPGTR